VDAGDWKILAGETRRPYVGSPGAESKTPRLVLDDRDICTTGAAREREKAGNPARER
jgi:hypothetical protein